MSKRTAARRVRAGRSYILHRLTFGAGGFLGRASALGALGQWAMAHHRLGHPDEARRWFDKAVHWMERAPFPKTERGGDNPDYSWNRRVAHEILRREAESLLKEAK
jgi:hypothetical protein